MAEPRARLILKRRQVDIPIYLTLDNSVSELEHRAVLDGINETVQAAGVAGEVEVKDFGYWDQGPGDYESAEWYVAKAMKHGFDKGYGTQIDASRLLNLLNTEPWQSMKMHKDIFVTGRDLYCAGLNFIIGMARPGFGTVISPVRFRGLNKKAGYECVKTETMHEFGHVFWAATGRDGIDILTGRGGSNAMLYSDHCACNDCTMRQGVSVPDAWVVAAQDRLDRGKGFCPTCVDDMVKFFKK